MLKFFRTALFRHVFSIAYLALVLGACVLNAPVAILFFSFFAPFSALGSVLMCALVTLCAAGKHFEPEKFRAGFAQLAADLRGQSFLSRLYFVLMGVALFSMLVIGLHPIYAFFYLVGLAGSVAFRALLNNV